MVAMRLAVRLVFFVALASVAAGCTGGSAKPNLSTASASSPPSTSAAATSATPKPINPYPADVPLTGHNVRPGEKPPLYPQAARVKSQDGADAFAEFFMRTLDWAYATTNPSYLKHYSGPSCGLCSGLATGISKTAAEHHWYLGGRLTVHPATPTPIGSVTAPADYCSITTADVTAASVVDRTGKVFNGQGALPDQTFKLCAKQDSDGWRTTYLTGAS